MKKHINFLTTIFLALLMQGLFMNVLVRAETAPASEPGVYHGFSMESYNGWERFSQYVPVRDGTLLAVDYFIPTLDGALASEPHPVVWTHHRYHRAGMQNGSLRTMVDGSPGLQRLLRHGYIVAVVDVRGGGASFGVRTSEFSHEETNDAYDITGWLANQAWSDGNIGMFGASYLGITQYLAASEAPPALKAIMPEMAMFDIYDFLFSNGAFRRPFLKEWSAMVRYLDQQRPPVAVDDDPGGELLQQARAMRHENIYPEEIILNAPYRDNYYEPIDAFPNAVINPATYAPAISQSAIPVYHIAGWFDAWPRDAFLWRANLDVPMRITVGPWSHNGTDPFGRTSYTEFIAAEQHRWFDYWLKGIDNGIMDEDPILFYTIHAPEATQWKTTATWPPEHTSATRFYLSPGSENPEQNKAKGRLLREFTYDEAQVDTLVVDYTATSGPHTRWANTHGGRFDYPDMRINEGKGLHYYYAVEEEPLTITGHPVITLYVSANVDNFDLVVFLEDVTPDGPVQYVTEGVINSRSRLRQDPEFDYMGLPYRRGNEDDVRPSPITGIFELTFDLHPTSYTFRPGHALRITITGADMHNLDTHQWDSPPVIEIFRSEEYPSSINLPVVTAETGTRGLFLFIFVIIVLVLYFILRKSHRREKN